MSAVRGDQSCSMAAERDGQSCSMAAELLCLPDGRHRHVRSPRRPKLQHGSRAQRASIATKLFMSASLGRSQMTFPRGRLSSGAHAGPTTQGPPERRKPDLLLDRPRGGCSKNAPKNPSVRSGTKRIRHPGIRRPRGTRGPGVSCLRGPDGFRGLRWASDSRSSTSPLPPAPPRPTDELHMIVHLNSAHAPTPQEARKPPGNHSESEPKPSAPTPKVLPRPCNFINDKCELRRSYWSDHSFRARRYVDHRPMTGQLKS